MKQYWSAVVKHILPWNELTNKELSKVDLREKYIITQAIIIQALGVLGNHFLINDAKELEKSIAGLEKVDWLRSAECWKGRVIRSNGKIINSNDAARLACNVLKETLGIPLDSEDLVYEEKFTKGK